MGRKPKGERFLGPYPAGRRWRVVEFGIVDDDRPPERTDHFFATKEAATRRIKEAKSDLEKFACPDVAAALEEYERYLTTRGNRPGTITTTLRRVGQFLGDPGANLIIFTPAECRRIYDSLEGAVDTHRNTLNETRTFFKWCVARGWFKSNPTADIEGRGVRNRGKPQLRVEESRRWLDEAVKHAKSKDGAVAAMTTILLALRASEVVARVARDVDDNGRLLWVPFGKTKTAKRTLIVPRVLQPFLRDLAKGKRHDAPLFSGNRDWVTDWVARICKWAGVPRVTAQGMRGTHSSLALEHGATGSIVAAALGHASFKITERYYAKAEAVSGAKQGRVLKVLRGGK